MPAQDRGLVLPARGGDRVGVAAEGLGMLGIAAPEAM